MIYRAVMATVLLYGSESWVLSQTQIAWLESFHMEAACYIMGMRIQKVTGKQVHPMLAAVLAMNCLQALWHYIQQCLHNIDKTIAGYLVLKELGDSEIEGLVCPPLLVRADPQCP